MSQFEDLQFAIQQLALLQESIELALTNADQAGSLAGIVGTRDEPLFKLALQEASFHSREPNRANRLLSMWFEDTPDSPRCCADCDSD